MYFQQVFLKYKVLFIKKEVYFLFWLGLIVDLYCYRNLHLANFDWSR